MRPERSQRRRAIKREEQKLARQTRAARKTWRDTPFRVLFRWINVFGFLSLAALLGVAYLSPLFEVRAISVVGEQRVLKSEIENSLVPLIGENLLRVSDSTVAQLLEGHPLIESFALQAIPPGELQVRIRERQPVLVLSDGKAKVLVDVSGIAISAQIDAADSERLPTLKVRDISAPGAPFEAAVVALLEFPTELFHSVKTVEVSAGGTLTLRLREPEIRVIWGGPEEAALKYEVLLSLLANQGAENIEVDVTTPRSPVVRYLDF